VPRLWPTWTDRSAEVDDARPGPGLPFHLRIRKKEWSFRRLVRAEPGACAETLATGGLLFALWPSGAPSPAAARQFQGRLRASAARLLADGSCEVYCSASEPLPKPVCLRGCGALLPCCSARTKHNAACALSTCAWLALTPLASANARAAARCSRCWLAAARRTAPSRLIEPNCDSRPVVRSAAINDVLRRRTKIPVVGDGTPG